MELGDQFATLQIKYEDLLLNTQETIELISKTWHVGRLGERFVNLEQSTKLDAKTFSDYQRYYLAVLPERRVEAESFGRRH